jgi:repressor LexA
MKSSAAESLHTLAQHVQTFFSTHNRMPSYSEAATLFGVKSKDTAYRLMQKLAAVGVVGKSRGGRLVPTNSNDRASYSKTKNKSALGALYMLGLVEAGFPTPAEESLREQISLDDWLIPKRESSFMVRVKGESMRDAGIHDGDMVIAERSMEAKAGTIVIAELDGEWTLKTLRRDRQGLYLEPANTDFPSIMRPQRSLKISAIVRGVVRKY